MPRHQQQQRKPFVELWHLSGRSGANSSTAGVATLRLIGTAEGRAAADGGIDSAAGGLIMRQGAIYGRKSPEAI